MRIDAGNVVWSLIDNGKLAKKIARLAAIVVKRPLERFQTFPNVFENDRRVPKTSEEDPNIFRSNTNRDFEYKSL